MKVFSIMVNTYYTFVKTESTTLRVNPNVSYGFWGITVCYSRFADFNTCTSLGQDAHSGGKKGMHRERG